MNPAAIKSLRSKLLYFCGTAACLISIAHLKPIQAQERVEAEDPLETQSLFDGKSLKGWSGDPRYWSVKNGAIVGSTHTKGIGQNTFLVADQIYGDFELQLQFKLTNHASGIQIRSKIPDPDRPFIVVGYQADIGGGDTGTFYEEQGRGNLAVGDMEEVRRLFKPNGWNSYTIRAVGNHFVVKLNGEITSTYQETQRPCPATGCIALQLQAGPAMKIEFRDLKVRPIRP
jgi:hypothetical protein